MSMAALALPPPLPHRCRCGGGGAAAADFLKNHRGASRQRQTFFPKTLKKCMNLIEFQC
jgi:hypothetical protein